MPMDMLEEGSLTAQRPSASRSGAAHTLPEQATASQLAEDEELLALAMEDADEPLRQQPAAPEENAPAQQQPSLSQLAEDEELLALAMEDMDEPNRQQSAASKEGDDFQVQQQPSLSQLAEDEELLALAMEDEAPKASLQQPDLAAPPAHTSAQQQPSVSQLAEDEELLALAMEEDEPQNDVAEASRVTDHKLQPAASRPAEDEQLAVAGDGKAMMRPSQLQLHSQQKLSQASMPAATKQLGRLSQLSASQSEEQTTDLEDADEQEQGNMDKRPSHLPQASEQAAMAVLQGQDSEEEEDDAPLVFTRKKQAVLSE